MGWKKQWESITYLLKKVMSLIFCIVKVHLLYRLNLTTNLKFLVVTTDLFDTSYFYSRGKYLNFNFIYSHFGFNPPPPRIIVLPRQI